MSASETDIFEALGFLAATFPNRLPDKTRHAWAALLARESFERPDLVDACHALVHEHAEIATGGADPANRWRLDLGPFIACARRARGARVERQRTAGAAKALPAPGTTKRDPLRDRATAATLRWLSRCVSERRVPNADAIQARTKVCEDILRQAQQLGCSLTEDGLEAALASEAIGRVLQRLCSTRRAA